MKGIYGKYPLKLVREFDEFTSIQNHQKKGESLLKNVRILLSNEVERIDFYAENKHYSIELDVRALSNNALYKKRNEKYEWIEVDISSSIDGCNNYSFNFFQGSKLIFVQRAVKIKLLNDE